MSLRQKVFTDCAKLLEPKYKWVTSTFNYDKYPPFILPHDPTEDIKNALAWKNIVDSESNGRDQGDCYYAVQFKDNGSKIYRININVLDYLNKNTNKRQDWIVPSDDDIKLASDRWWYLENACYECRKMIRDLYHNS